MGWGDSGWWTLRGKCCLHHQLHTHVPQPIVGVCGQVPMCHHLVSVSEVPDVVNGGGGFEVPTGIVELDFEDHVLSTKENIISLVDRSLLRNVDRHWDLI